MLSSHSFNALLKTLEEPPPYVKFLLATTDPKRLPITILSRCLQFHLKRVPVEQIENHLQQICTAENISYEAGALTLLANAADGSVRDALSLLDQTIAFCGEKINLLDTQKMLGTISEDGLFRLLHALKAEDGSTLLAEIENLESNAVNFYQALDDILSILHQISIAQIIPEAPQSHAEILTFAKLFTPADIQLYYQIALNGRRDLPFAPHPRHGFEMILLRMLAFQPMTKTQVVQAPKEKKKPEESKKPVATVAPPSPPTENTRTWVDMLAKLELTGMAHALASNCTMVEISDTKVTLALAVQHEPMLNKKLIERIEQALDRYLQKPIKLEVQITAVEGETPVKKQHAENKERKARATAAIKNDDDIQKMMGLFDATLDMDSIKTV
jgi:DNA polymerase-3 subunit gamma/tau